MRAHFGGSLSLELTASRTLPHAYGYRGARMLHVFSNTPGLTLTLPSVASAGGDIQYAIFNDGSLGTETFNVNSHAVAPGYSALCRYSSAGWLVQVVSTIRGSSVTSGRRRFAIKVASVTENLNVQQFITAWRSWDGSSPVLVDVYVISGALLRARTPADYALDSGTLPSGSLVSVHVSPDGFISAAGGAGGRGGDVSGLLAQPGSAGGDAIRNRGLMVIRNDGTIQGGGGGGGGGVASSPAGGGGGGGGAGARGGARGFSGAPAAASSNGVGGGLSVGGAGGLTGTPRAGGAGGAPGAAGSAAGAAGGAAGRAIVGATGLNILRTGTILGAVV